MTGGIPEDELEAATERRMRAQFDLYEQGDFEHLDYGKLFRAVKQME